MTDRPVCEQLSTQNMSTAGPKPVMNVRPGDAGDLLEQSNVTVSHVV